MKLSTAQAITLACLWEVMPPKPGNVHRGADFDDIALGDFATSAVLIGPLLAEAASRGVGHAILDAVQATRDAIGSNTNLGMILLLAPLAAVEPGSDLRGGVARVLGALGADDAAAVYQAINVAQPGGLGKVEDADVAGPPPPSLVEAMRLAAGRDSIARQYAEDYRDIFESVVPALVDGCQRGLSLTNSIVLTYVGLIARFGDSLIARKGGIELSKEAARRAQQVLAAGAPGDEKYHAALADFDFWLRCDGHRRNPGASADLMAAGLYVVFRDNLIPAPWK